MRASLRSVLRFFSMFLLFKNFDASQECAIQKAHVRPPIRFSSKHCSRMDMDLVFTKFEQINFQVNFANATCQPQDDLMIYVKFLDCLAADMEFVFTGTTARLVIYKPFRGTNYEVISEVFNQNSLNFTVSERSLSINNSTKIALNWNCRKLFVMNKGKAVVPVTVEFTTSPCAAEFEFTNGVAQPPSRRRNPSLNPPTFQHMDPQLEREFSDDSLFNELDADSSRLWQIMVIIAAFVTTFVMAMIYVLTNGFKRSLKSGCLEFKSAPTLSFANPNADLPAGLADAQPMAQLSRPTYVNVDVLHETPVLFSSGGVHIGRKTSPTAARADDDHAFASAARHDAAG